MPTEVNAKVPLDSKRRWGPPRETAHLVGRRQANRQHVCGQDAGVFHRTVSITVTGRYVQRTQCVSERG